MQVGNRHFVECADNSILDAFEFDYASASDNVRITYTCLESPDIFYFEGAEPRETQYSDSGDIKSGRNSLESLSKHEVNCNGAFLKSWYLRQWSHSMNIVYQCTSLMTPFRDGCQVSYSRPVGRLHRKLSAFRRSMVTCKSGTALTHFRFNGTLIEYTCCPHPSRVN